MPERHLTQIGKYEVECVIGEGSMGVVYRAVDPLINRRVAIKVMNDAVAQDVSLRERFLREAQTAGSLQHPNVVTIYDFGEIDDHLFIAMEYVEGDDLSDLLQKKVGIPIIEALDLIIGLLHGLGYAHKRGIIHRDIKPANIRVDAEGKARLMDFGVAHLASSDMTSTGMLLGTPAYMAPEQITGGSVTAETDIFSVGAVLYELLAGKRPFVGDTLQSLMYSILNRAPESLEAVVPGLPAGLHDVAMRALKKEPGERYHSAMAMANDLAAIRDSLDPEGRRTSLSLRAAIDTALARETRARDRRRLGAQVGTFAAGVLLAAGVFAAARTLMSRPASSDAQRVSAGTTSPVATRAAVAAPASPPPDTTAAVARSLPVASSVARPRDNAHGQTSSALSQSTTAGIPKLPGLAHRQDAAAVTHVDTTPPPLPLQRNLPNETTLAVTQQQASVAAPVRAPTPTPASAPPPPTRENTSEQVATVIAAYARALETLDLGEVRRVYPAMTSQQRSAFSDFFRSIRTLKANLTVANVQADGQSAEAQVTGTFDYVTTSGVGEQRKTSFVVSLHRDRGAWAIAAIH
jgi:eukaryotic-like serine/threonine-protein kinase